MIATQWVLLQREFWEHRAILVTPLIIAVIVVLMSITGQVTVSTFDDAVDLAIIGASSLGDSQRAAAISAISMAIATLFLVAMGVLTLFYLLDALYAERKDKSILFWRSLPVTDSETVISKVLTAVVAIPLVTFAGIATTHLLVLAISGLWVAGRGGDAVQLIWNAAPLAANWTASLILCLAIPLWFAPLSGWFLFVSAWTRRSPFLIAILPLIVLPMLERILLGSTLFTRAIYVRLAELPLFTQPMGANMVFGDSGEFPIPEGVDVTLLSILDLSKFFSDPGLWIGIVVGGLFIAAAIYVRRYRDES